MGGKRNAERAQQVKKICAVAAPRGIARLPANAGRRAVQEVVDALSQCQSLPNSDKQQVLEAWCAFKAMYAPSADDDAVGAAESNAVAEGQGDAAGKKKNREWKFQAAQFTYNKATDDWASDQAGVLEALFLRFVAFVQLLGRKLRAKGVSATMEESGDFGEHVHMHMYFHSDVAFHKEGPNALNDFVFDGIRPHVEENRARKQITLQKNPTS